MYGKFFASTFTGSMFGAGTAVFAVWGYVIANTVDARVELNPKLLASILGTTVEAVEQAINELCEPDPLSRNGDAEGRRLQREGQYQYRVTSHEIYRALKNEEDRRAYNRDKQRKSRAKHAVNGNGYQPLPMSAHTEADLEAEAETEAEAKKNKLTREDLAVIATPVVIPTDRQTQTFDAFWQAYPRKAGKGAAFKVWKKIKPDGQLIEDILTAIGVQRHSEQWTKDGGQFIPHPSTWLNQGRWQDQLTPANGRAHLDPRTRANLEAAERFASRKQLS